jgi:hypothetical protein
MRLINAIFRLGLLVAAYGFVYAAYVFAQNHRYAVVQTRDGNMTLLDSRTGMMHTMTAFGTQAAIVKVDLLSGSVMPVKLSAAPK